MKKEEIKLTHWDAFSEIYWALDHYITIEGERQEWFDIVSNALERLDKLEKGDK